MHERVGHRRLTIGIILAPLCTLISIHAGEAQNRRLFPSDTIPRNRLLTTDELLQTLNLSLPALSPVATQLESGNLQQALSNYLDYIRSRPNPCYFVNAADMPRRVAAYADIHSDDLAYAVDATSNYMKTYGTDVDWRVPGRDQLGTPHTPNTVRFLARQLYAENFAVLALLRNDRSYVDFQMAQLRDFLADFELGDVERGGNDVFERFYGGHRIRNLMMFHRMLLNSDMLSDEDHALLIKSFLLHGAIIVEKCSKFNWGNHQLVGLCALFEMTALYPEFPVMREWNGRVFELILEHLDKEVKEDGFQFERASHYFKLDIYNYFRTFRLAEMNGIEVPAWALERFRRMFGAIVAVLMPNGAMPPLQDAQDTYIGNRNIDDARKSLGVSETENSAELVDPSEGPFMALGAYVFKDPLFKHFGDPKLHPAFSWFLPEDADDVYRSLDAKVPGFTSTALTSSGYYVMRSGWNRDDSYMIIDGGLAQYKPDHTHGGILGLICYAKGAMLLPNYRVRYSDPSYPYLKNSYAKNVALADSMLQGRGWIGNAARTGFGKWAWLPTPTVDRWVTGRTLDYFSATHNAFDTIGVKYRRSVLFIKPDTWVVVDSFSGDQDVHTFQQLWQGAFLIGENNRISTSKGKARLDIEQVHSDRLWVATGAAFGTSFAGWSAGPAKEWTYFTVLRASGGSGPVPEISRTDDGCEVRTVNGKIGIRTPSRHAGQQTIEGEVEVVRYDNAGPVEFGAVGATSMKVDGFELISRAPASIELRKVGDRSWVGFLLEGETETLLFRSPDGKTRTVPVSGMKPFNIRW